jgi:hypothetical protein
MKLRNGSYRDYTPDHYELGYQLVAYGYEKYGEDFWRKVTQDAVQFKGIFFSYKKAIEKYTGISYQQFRENAMKLFAEKNYNSNAVFAERCVNADMSYNYNQIAKDFYELFTKVLSVEA